MSVEITAACPGPSAEFSRLLVHGDAGVPAPVDEDPEQDAVGECAERDRERVEPLRSSGGSSLPAGCLVHLDERDDGEDREDHHLRAQEEQLCPGGELDPAVTDPRHDRDPEDRGDDDRRRRVLADCQPTRRYVYCAAITESDAITITSATKIAQPLIQPSYGPNARVAHANVVPQSGSARLRYL